MRFARYDAGRQTFLSLLINCWIYVQYVVFSNDILRKAKQRKIIILLQRSSILFSSHRHGRLHYVSNRYELLVYTTIQKYTQLVYVTEVLQRPKKF
jgi:hypothetical protein